MADELVKKRITEYTTEVTADDLDNSDVIFVDSTQHGTRKLRLKGIRDIISCIQNEGIKSSGVSVTADNYATTITNVNDQPVNTIYAYAAGLQSNISNLPSNAALNILHYTYKYSVSTNVGQVQIAIERSGENPAMYFRTTSGTPVTWGSWVKMANNADVEAIREELDNLDIETDATLSISGKPADAKATGDEISDIKADLISHAVNFSRLERGTVENGIKKSSGIRLRLKNTVEVFKGQKVIFAQNPNNYYFQCQVYSDDLGSEQQTPLEMSAWLQDKYEVSNNGYLTVLIANGEKYATSTTITVDDFNGSEVLVVFNGEDPKTYTEAQVNIGTNAIPVFDCTGQRLTVTLPNTTLTYIGGKASYRSYTAQQIASQLPSENFSYDETSMTFTITGPIGILYYDMEASTFGVANNSVNAVRPEWLILVMNWYKSLYGQWVWKAGYEKVIQLEKNKGISPYFQKMQKYAKYLYGDTKVSGFVTPAVFENFIWFTDPHTMYGDYTEDESLRTYGCKNFDKYISELAYVYQSTPTDFVLCGGDWNDGGIPEEELFKLSRAKEICDQKLSPFYNCVGNHDTNYQGKKDADSAKYTSKFSPESLKNLWYRDYEHCYFTFSGKNTKFYCFDSRSENQDLTTENNYLLNQLKWFASALEDDNSPHIALAMHIYYYNNSDALSDFTTKLMEIACSYNAKSSYQLNGTTYDFSETIGKIDYVFAGHSHRDYDTTFTYVNETIPIVASINAGNSTGATNSYAGAPHCIMDLVHVNYDTRKINLVRIGELGTDREISF